MKHMLHQMETFVLKRTLKVIQTDLEELINKPGCDASNMFDEEVHNDDLEFSDDEKEKERKRQKKQKKNNKNLEDGEIELAG